MQEKFNELYIFCESIFGSEVLKKDSLKDPEGINIEINATRVPSSPVTAIELSLYRDENDIAFMLVDDFRFEYNDNNKAILEMKQYMQALADGRLHVVYKKIFGISFGKRLVIS